MGLPDTPPPNSPRLRCRLAGSGAFELAFRQCRDTAAANGTIVPREPTSAIQVEMRSPPVASPGRGLCSDSCIFSRFRRATDYFPIRFALSIMTRADFHQLIRLSLATDGERTSIRLSTICCGSFSHATNARQYGDNARRRSRALVKRSGTDLLHVIAHPLLPEALSPLLSR